MKVLITDYSFNPVAKTVTFNGLQSIELNRLLLITNATRNTIIYNFASPALGGTVSGNVITLGTSTTGMQASDRLQIFYENDDPLASDDTLDLLRRIIITLRGVQNVDSSDRQRVTVDAFNAQVGVNAATLSNITNANFDFRELLYLLDRTNFGSSIRPFISQT